MVGTNGTNGNEPEGLLMARRTAVPNTLKNRVEAGVLAHSFSIKTFSNIEVVHYAAAAGFDAILVDLEHGSLGLETTNQLSVAALQVG